MKKSIPRVRVGCSHGRRKVTPSDGVKVDKVERDVGLKAEGLKDAKPGESGGALSITYPLGNPFKLLDLPLSLSWVGGVRY